jgi:hypothetical protein
LPGASGRRRCAQVIITQKVRIRSHYKIFGLFAIASAETLTFYLLFFLLKRRITSSL